MDSGIQDDKATSGAFTPNDYLKLTKHSAKADHILEIIRLSCCISKVPLRKRLETLEIIHNSHTEYSVHELCEALEVDRGTFYNHIFRRRDTKWKDEQEHLYLRIVRQIYDDSNQRYGADRIRAEMRSQGISISKQHVLELMRELNIESMGNGAKKVYNKKMNEAVNRVRRAFSVDKPNMVWVSDITYFKFCGKGVYICVIIDLFSRMVVGHTISENQSKQIVSSAMKKAIEERKPALGLIFHTDRGTQYTSNSFVKLLEKNGIVQSLSDPGQPHDNAVAEAFFSTLKKEELYRSDYRSVNALKQSVAEYIEYYNSDRTHSYLGYNSPAKYEEKFAKNDNA